MDRHIKTIDKKRCFVALKIRLSTLWPDFSQLFRHITCFDFSFVGTRGFSKQKSRIQLQSTVIENHAGFNVMAPPTFKFTPAAF